MKMQFILGTEGRKGLVKAVSSILGAEAIYLGAPGFCYNVGGCIIDKDGGMDIPDNMDAAALAEKLSDMGFERKDDDLRCSIAISADGFGERAMGNLKDLIRSKDALVRKALGIESLTAEHRGENIIFSGFSSEITAEELGVYAQFLSALVKMAREQQRITAKPTEVENEKYAFRCFLLRLGFIGKEYAQARKLLLSRMSGNSAFKHTNNTADKDSLSGCSSRSMG